MAEKKTALSRRVTLRLPEASAAEWRRRADAADQSLSDWLRQRVDGADAVQTGQRRQRRRLRTLTADPVLLRELAAQGSNFNEVLRSESASAPQKIWLSADQKRFSLGSTFKPNKARSQKKSATSSGLRLPPGRSHR